MSIEATERTARVRGGGSTRRAIARIDHALAASISRNAFSRDQALRTLEDIEGDIGDPALADRAAAVVNAAAASYRGEAVVDRGRFLDALLDIRALLVGHQP